MKTQTDSCISEVVLRHILQFTWRALNFGVTSFKDNMTAACFRFKKKLQVQFTVLYRMDNVVSTAHVVKPP